MVSNEPLFFENWSPHLEMDIKKNCPLITAWSPHLKMVKTELVSFDNWPPHLKMVKK